MRVLHPQQPPPVGQPLVGGVEQAQLHELVGGDVVDHLHPDLLQRGPPGGEVVLEHPLAEGFADHWPGVLNAESAPKLRDIRLRGLRGDPIDHAAGEGDVAVDPVGQLRVTHRGLGDDRRARHLPVAGQVVTAQDRERHGSRFPTASQRLDDVAEGRRRLTRVLGVVDGAGTEDVELACRVVDVVTALGDRQRDDPGGRCAQEGQDRLRVVGGEEVVVDRADDGGLVVAVGVLQGQGVGVVLGGERVSHAGVARQEPDPADAPVQAGVLRIVGPGAVSHEAVEVHGLVGAVEAADADVDDPGRDRRAVVGGGEVAAVGGGGHGWCPVSLGSLIGWWVAGGRRRAVRRSWARRRRRRRARHQCAALGRCPGA